MQLREQRAIAQAEKHGAEELLAEVRGQVQALQREVQEARERARSHMDERDMWQNERARATAQAQLLKQQKADVETLARRWQADNEALQARLDAASQRLGRLSVERDEAVWLLYAPTLASAPALAPAPAVSAPAVPAPAPTTSPKQVRQRDVEMRQLQGQGSQLGEMMRLAMQARSRMSRRRSRSRSRSQNRSGRTVVLRSAVLEYAA